MIGLKYTADKNVYVVIRNAASDVWNGTAFESYNVANWGDYDVPMTGAGFEYTVANPTAEDLDDLDLTFFERLGGSPLVTDYLIPIGTTGGLGGLDETLKPGSYQTFRTTTTGIVPVRRLP